MSADRVIGFDIARALAVFGMVVVNFQLASGTAAHSPHALLSAVGLLEGRAAAMFVVLAGIGISLMTRRAREQCDTGQLRRQRNSLLTRAVCLFVIGLAYSSLWPADILHFYGIYITVGALMLSASNVRLASAAAAFVAVFFVLLFLLDYERGWDWQSLSYADFWTPTGMVRHLLFNGFHPVFPWTAFLLLGMILGRLSLRDRTVRNTVLLTGLVAAVSAESASMVLSELVQIRVSGAPAEDLLALVGTEPMPPVPLYMVAGAGWAAAAIALCVGLSERFPASALWPPLVATGQLALTLYVAHVAVGMVALDSMGRLEHQTPEFAMSSALLFCLLAVAFATLWRRRFHRGPLEWLLRRLTQALSAA